MVRLKIQFGENDIIEVESANEDSIDRMVNRVLKKFYADTKFVKDVKEPF